METSGEIQLLLGPVCNPFLPEYFKHSEASEWQLQSGITAGGTTNKHKETLSDFFLKSNEE